MTQVTNIGKALNRLPKLGTMKGDELGLYQKYREIHNEANVTECTQCSTQFQKQDKVYITVTKPEIKFLCKKCRQKQKTAENL